MGFSVPGALGAGLADPQRRPFVLVGDGAFRMTGSELATLAELRLRPIVLVLNNSCFAMLEALDRPRSCYDLHAWDYVAFARALGCAGERVATAGALHAALRQAEASSVSYLIEAVLDKGDVSPVMRRQRVQRAARRRGEARRTPATAAAGPCAPDLILEASSP